MSHSLETSTSIHNSIDAPAVRSRVGVVVIGRNEGERLKRCIRSVQAAAERVVYVDSGSKDGSQAWARERGVEVLELDTEVPFTMARARNRGLSWHAQQPDPVDFIQFVDGDCEMIQDWIEHAAATLASRPDVVAICGRRRERDIGASIYNRLIDMEWHQPAGEAAGFTGDVMIRLRSLIEVGGFEEAMIAGEDSELAYRLRLAGGRILQVDREMSIHDAAIFSMRQWLIRAKRAGFWYADGHHRHGEEECRMNRREIRSAWVWGVLLPAAFVLALLAGVRWGGVFWGLAIGFGLLWTVQAFRIAAARRKLMADPWRSSVLYGFSCMVCKPAQVLGILEFHRARRQGRRAELIEYK